MRTSRSQITTKIGAASLCGKISGSSTFMSMHNCVGTISLMRALRRLPEQLDMAVSKMWGGLGISGTIDGNYAGGG